MTLVGKQLAGTVRGQEVEYGHVWEVVKVPVLALVFLLPGKLPEIGESFNRTFRGGVGRRDSGRVGGVRVEDASPRRLSEQERPPAALAPGEQPPEGAAARRPRAA